MLIAASIAAAGLRQEDQAFGWFTAASAVVFCSLSLLSKGTENHVVYSKQLLKGKIATKSAHKISETRKEFSKAKGGYKITMCFYFGIV